MYRLITSIGIFFCLLSGLKAQEQSDFNRINEDTYRLYLEQKWDSLIVLGKEALKQDFDYYYLRIRLGIAYYHSNNYRRAASHFTVALEFNQGDPVALEYLYFSRLLAGQTAQSRLVKEQFRGNLALKLPAHEPRFLDRFSANYLYHQADNDDQFTNPDEVYAGLSEGVQSTTRNFSNGSLSLVNSLSPGITLTHSFNLLSKINHYYYNDGTFAFYMPDQHLRQTQYYISPHFTTRSGFQWMPMLHIIGIHYQTPLYLSSGGFQGGSSQVVVGYLDEVDLVSGLGLKKGMGSVDLFLGAWYSNLNQAKQFQNKLGITWFPGGNLNLYMGAYGNSQYETISGKEGTFRIIPEFLLGFAISEKVWFDLNAAMGEMTNYLENNGSIVYNSFSEVIEKKVKFSISIPVSDKGSLLYLGGKWTAMRSEFYPFEANTTDLSNPINYNAISIYGGVSWKF